MSKANPKNKEIKDYQSEIDRLKKEIEGLRDQSKIAALETQIADLQSQKKNAQISQEQSMTYVPGYDEEFQRLKEDAIKQQKKAKKERIKACIGNLFEIPFTFAIIYIIFVVLKLQDLINFFTFHTKIIYWLFIALFTFIEFQAIFNLIKAILVNPEILPDETLSYLSLTAKEHVLDPKGSVIREKYGTGKWSSVTST